MSSSSGREFYNSATLLYYLLSFVFGTLVISMFGHDVLTSAGASIACLGNIGPGFGAVEPFASFNFFTPGAKIFMSFLMLLGRLELFTVIILLTPAFWKKV